MNYQALYQEISLPRYDGVSDAEIVAALNATATTRRRVSVVALNARALEVGATLALRVEAATPETPPQIKALCEEALSLVSSRLTDIDMDHPAARQMFGALGQARILSAEQLAALDALATVTAPSRAMELGLGTVAEADIQAARGWMIGELQAEAALIQARLDSLQDNPSDAELLGWAQANYPFAELHRERTQLEARLAEINDLLAQLGG